MFPSLALERHPAFLGQEFRPTAQVFCAKPGVRSGARAGLPTSAARPEVIAGSGSGDRASAHGKRRPFSPSRYPGGARGVRQAFFLFAAWFAWTVCGGSIGKGCAAASTDQMPWMAADSLLPRSDLFTQGDYATRAVSRCVFRIPRGGCGFRHAEAGATIGRNYIQ